MTKTKNEKDVELYVLLDVATMTRRVMSDVKAAALGQAHIHRTTVVNVLDKWRSELLKDPYYLLPNDTADPRNPQPLRERNQA